MSLPLSLNHVFVDYENVQALDLSVIGNKGVTFTLLLGPQKKKLDVELVEQLFTHAASVELVRLTSPGRNALDFTLAYYIGRAVAADPTGFFHIISKDTGYDPMIEHLRSRNIDVCRHDDFSKLPFLAVAKQPAATTKTPPKSAKSKAPVVSAETKTKSPVKDDLLARARDHLRTHPQNRPRNQAKLATHLLSVFRSQATENEVEKLIKDMIDLGHIVISEKGAVSYALKTD